MKKVISLLLTAMLLLSMLPATMAEGVEYIPAPYVLDAERAGPKAYVEPVFYANGEGEPTIGVTYVGVIKADGKYFKDSNNNHELDPFEDWRLDPETRAADGSDARCDHLRSGAGCRRKRGLQQADGCQRKGV